MTDKEPKTDAEYIFQEPCSQPLINARAEILGELMLRKRLRVEVVDEDLLPKEEK